jgi:hypothetical protein
LRSATNSENQSLKLFSKSSAEPDPVQ